MIKCFGITQTRSIHLLVLPSSIHRQDDASILCEPSLLSCAGKTDSLQTMSRYLFRDYPIFAYPF